MRILPSFGKYHLFPVFVFPILVVLLYGNTFLSSFHFDDQGGIENNKAIHSISDPVSIAASTPSRPLLMLSFALNYHFGGKNVFGYHLVNITLHVFSCILLYISCLILYTLLKYNKRDNSKIFFHQAARGVILFSVFFYAFQPLNTEAVTYISSRSSSLATCFLLLSFCFFLKSRKKEACFKNNGIYICIAWFCYCLSLASKEIGITLPCLIFAADYYFFFLPRQNVQECFKAIIKYFKERWIGLSPYFLIILAYFAYRYYLQGAFTEEKPAFLNLYSKGSYFYTQINVIFHYYLNKVFFPLNLNVDIFFDIYNSLLGFSTIIAFFLLTLLFLITIKNSAKAPWFFFAVFWFFVTLSPTSSFFPITDVAVERRLYLPAIAVALLAVHLLSNLSARKLMLFILILVFFSTSTILRNFVYSTPLTLWRDSASKSIREPRPQFNYSITLKKTGQLEEAMVQYKKVLSMPDSPYNHDVYNSMGIIYMEKGLFEKAVDSFMKSIKIKNDHDLPHNNLGTVYLKMGQLEKAEEAFRTALSVNPDNFEARNNLGVIYAQRGMHEEAHKEFTVLLEKDPFNMEVRNNLERLKKITLTKQINNKNHISINDKK